MDPDEVLARRLQELEFQGVQAAAVNNAAAAAAAAAQERMALHLELAVQHIREAEDPLNQALALSVMPLDEMHATAHRTAQLNRDDCSSGPEQPPLGVQDYLMQELLLWFKYRFFAWVDRPPCGACGFAGTRAQGTGPPSPEEEAYQASRTEVFACPQCGAHTRFPRYNAVAKLLETRRGRCGEWANAFLLCARAAGLDARYVWDINDHVWTEFWSDVLGRWVHVDSCEAAFDKPLLYEAGWGKAMTYVVAVGTGGMTDVTPRYTARWLAVLAARTGVPEPWLRQRLQAATTALRAGLPAAQLTALQLRDAQEQQELALRQAGHVSPRQLQGLSGRTTGDEAWRQGRGEAGTAAAPPPTTAPSSPLSSPPTRWVALPTQPPAPSCPELWRVVGRPRGGGARASGENGRGEGAACAFDGGVGTKWLDFGGAAGSGWLQFKLEPGEPAVALAAYDVVSANDSPERDPKDWVLEGWAPSEPPNGAWVTLDARRGVLFAARHELQAFWLPVGTPQCTQWRLRVTSVRDPGAANSLQVGGLQLYASTPAWSFGDSPASAPVMGVVEPGGAEWAATTARRTLAAALPPDTVALLQRLLHNIVRAPHDVKFRRVRAAKVEQLWTHSVAPLAVLLAVGFRPLVLPAAPGAEPDAFLVLSGGDQGRLLAIRAAAEVLFAGGHAAKA